MPEKRPLREDGQTPAQTVRKRPRAALNMMRPVVHPKGQMAFVMDRIAMEEPTQEDRIFLASLEKKKRKAAKSLPKQITPATNKTAAHSIPKQITPATNKTAAHSLPKQITPATNKTAAKSLPKQITPATNKTAAHSIPKQITPATNKIAAGGVVGERAKPLPDQIGKTPVQGEKKRDPRTAPDTGAIDAGPKTGANASPERFLSAQQAPRRPTRPFAPWPPLRMGQNVKGDNAATGKNGGEQAKGADTRVIVTVDTKNRVIQNDNKAPKKEEGKLLKEGQPPKKEQEPLNLKEGKPLPKREIQLRRRENLLRRRENLSKKEGKSSI